MKEIIKKQEQVFQGDFLKVDRVLVELPNGREGIRDIVRHPGAVAVLAINDEDEILLEYQYRTALDEVILEIPAGKVDPAEDRTAAAHRELEEETGFSARSMEYLGDVALAAGYSDEKISLYLARGLSEGQEHRDEDEFLEWEFVPRSQVLEWIRTNQIQDSKTICAMFYLSLREF
ncbi:NUDIX hydrolase [Proteiniclasticum sp. QWL-01]|uniref:NUDIX domain-containing protein n=1 Tax=Proteiniclasticum sp. QWL-01 TaxID=3036945 RepID=UPI0022099F40|nr:NUDIX hydrolase [Proteiniclasticum sp. QWL-01]UUM12324.1 NUDIX hydrolase [Clostridiaceae bacterium HFYG-1003]WFF73854.1 NUDIX hydrolase [Proteiniclasticum sp. QWL-01]